MNDYRLCCALSFIDDDLINEAMEYRPVSKPKKVYFWRSAAAIACCAAAVGMVYLFKNRSGIESVTPPADTSVSAAYNSAGTLNDSEHSSLPVDLSAAAWEKWLNDPDVIWGDEQLKGDVLSDPIPLGTFRISPALSDMMRKSKSGAVFAIMADLSPCIDNADMENWVYCGDTISSLKKELDKLYFDTGLSYTYIDGTDGTEHTEPIRSSDPEDAGRIADLQNQIEAIRSAYFDMKISEFKDSFEKSGLEIYRTEDGSSAARHYFYTFASKAQLENFECKESEAFVFYPAQAIK